MLLKPRLLAAHSVAAPCTLQAPPPPRLQGPAFTQAAVESGVLLLLQRPRAVSPADCPGKQLAVAEVAGVGGWHRSRKQLAAAVGRLALQQKHRLQLAQLPGLLSSPLLPAPSIPLCRDAAAGP